MPLKIANSTEALDADVHLTSLGALFSSFPQLQDATKAHFNDQTLHLYDCQHDPILYVLQGESAIVSPQDEKIEIVFTDDTTTCITGIIRHRASGVTCLTHYDRPLEDNLFLTSHANRLLEKMISIVDIETNETDNQSEFDLYLIGGYCDEKNIAEELALYLLRQFNLIEGYRINLVCAVIGNLNTKWLRVDGGMRSPEGITIPSPIVYGAGIYVRTGQIVNAQLKRQSGFHLSGGIPLYDIRRAAVSFGNSKTYKEIYDPTKRLIEIQPVEFDSVNSIDALTYFQYALRLRDPDILKNFSTSPYVEPAHFCQDIRSVFQFFLGHRDKNIKRLYFPADKPRYYRLYRLLPSRPVTAATTTTSATSTDGSSANNDNAVQYRWKEVPVEK